MLLHPQLSPNLIDINFLSEILHGVNQNTDKNIPTNPLSYMMEQERVAWFVHTVALIFLITFFLNKHTNFFSLFYIFAIIIIK